MDYKIKAHPTRYAGIEFRSRLEATWAAFFDLTGWVWRYEPLDLHGWSPDFEISHKQHLATPIMVEVKPTWEQAEAAVDKIKASGTAKALLLGNGPGSPEGWADAGIATYDHKPGPAFGAILYFDQGEEAYGDNAFTFCPRLVSESAWKEATNITRWKPGT